MGTAPISDDKMILHKMVIVYYRSDSVKEIVLNLLSPNGNGP